MAQKKAKPLSFSTTLRNPERIPNFLKCILPFEGKILTSEIIHKVIKNVLREKEYSTLYIKNTPVLKNILKRDDEKFSDDQLEEIIQNSPQRHKEAGFNYGWDSRFDTWYKMIKEFGFIKYEMNKPIIITNTGHMLVDAYNEKPCNDKKVQTVFLNALMKYQTNNPLRRNKNENAPLPLLLNVIKLFHKDNNDSKGIARHELPILICWRDNNSKEAYDFIKEIRNKVGLNCSDEYIFEKCLSLLESDNRNYFKMNKICHEAVDEYIRKMRMTGLLSLRGNGRFLDINEFEKDTASYVANNYSKYKKYETEDDYINYMGSIDNNILSFTENESTDKNEIRKNTLKKYAKSVTKDRIKKELQIVCNKQESKHEIFKYINAPTRLEFLTSIALVQNFEDLDVNPNYAVDDEGLPTFHAAGGYADIECHDNNYDSYFEVTLMCGRVDQVNNEIIPISRHLKEAINKRRKESFSVLVAPIIHADTKEAAEWQKIKYNIDILTYNIDEFIKNIEEKECVSDLLSN